MASFVLSFFQLDVLDESWDLIESVSEGFLTYSYTNVNIPCPNIKMEKEHFKTQTKKNTISFEKGISSDRTRKQIMENIFKSD